MATLQPYKKYNAIAYDYARQLPDGWQLLPNIAVFQERIERGHINEELLSVTIGRGVIRQADVDIKKDSSNEDKSKYKLIKVGDIAYNKMRMWQGALGYSDYQGISSPAYVILKPKMKINPRYFHYMFRTSFYTNYSKRFSYGIVDDQLSLRYTDFKRMYSIVPPIEVQNSIVAYLDKKNNEIDIFIRNKERFIELINEEKKSIIYKAVTKGIQKNVELKESGDLWNGKIPTHWELVKFNHYINLRHGHQFRDFDFKAEGIKVVKITQLTYEGNLDLSECSYVDTSRVKEFKNDVILKGDILMALTGGTIGKIIRVNEVNEVLLQNYRVGNFNPSNKNKLDKDFLFWLLSSSVIFDQIMFAQRETGQPNIGKGDLGKMFFALPPLKEQKEIVKYIVLELEPFETAIIKAQKEISTIKEYREALITDLVMGKRSVPKLQMN